MGLDIVEFIMTVEEAFDLRIEDRVAETFLTPRDVINHVHRSLPQRTGSQLCLSQRAFYLLRRGFAKHTDFDRSGLKPDTKLVSLLIKGSMYTTWSAVADSIGIPKWKFTPNNLSRFFARKKITNLGDIAREAATSHPAALKHDGDGWTFEDVKGVVDRIMREHMGIRKYSLDDSFVDKLFVD